MAERRSRAALGRARSLVLLVSVALLTSLFGVGPAFAAGTLTVSTTAYNGATPAVGSPVVYVARTSLSGGNATSNIVVTQTMPSGVRPLAAYATLFTCAAPSGQSITCTTTGTSFNDGSSSPDITFIGIVTGSISAATIRSSSTTSVRATGSTSGSDTSMGTGTLPAAPSGLSASPALGPTSGGNTVTVTGSNLTAAVAVEIGTTAELQAGTPVTLLACASGVTTSCFSVSGSNLLVYMPARSTNATVSLTVVNRGVAGATDYVYAARPSTPATPTATAGQSSAVVTWTAPAANGSAITGYSIVPYLDGTAQTPVAADSAATSQTLTGLTPGGSYRFTVAATNAIGTSSASSKSAAVVPYATAAAPSVTSAVAGTELVTLSWTAPSSNGSAITGYRVTPYVNGTAQAVQTFTSTATTQQVTGLTAGTAYTFTVAALNGAGTGPASAASESVTPNAAPTLTFTAPPAGTVGVAYSTQLTVNGGTSPYTWTVSAGSLPAGLTLSTSGLLSGTPTAAGSSSFTVRVSDASARSATRAVTLVVTDRPSTPAAATAKAGLGSAVVTWAAPADNGSTITRYVITPYREGVAQPAVEVDPATTTRTVNGLTVGSAYSFTVAAVNANGTSAASPASNAVTPYAALAAPTITSVAAGSSAATLSWNAPTSTGGSPVTGYVVTPYRDGVAQPPRTFASTATTQTVTGLTPGSVYTFTVAATNLSGTTVLYRVNAAGPALAALDRDLPWSADDSETTPLRTSASGTATSQAGGAVADDTVPASTPNAIFDTERYGDPTWAFPVETGAKLAVRLYFVNRYDGTATPGARFYDVTLDGSTVLSGFDPVVAAGGTRRGTMREFSLSSDGSVDLGFVRRTENPLINGIEIIRTGVATTGPASTSSASVTPNAMPSLTFSPPPSGGVGVAYDQQLVVNGGTAPVAWSVSAGALPAGLTLSTNGRLSGTPTAAGTYDFTVRVVDASGESATRAVRLVVAAPPSLAFTPAAGEVSVPYSQQPTVTGGTSPFTFAVTAGSLPPGVSVDASTGLVSGTPTTAGRYSATVTVTDALNQSASRTVSIVIAALPTLGVASTTAPQVGVDYSNSFPVSGGTAPFTWSVASGNLPAGLSLDTGTGALSGTPTTAGAYSATIAVVDSFGKSSTRTFAGTVAAGPLVVTKTASSSSTVAGGTVSYTITVNNTGTSTFSDVALSDPLAGVLDDATYEGDARATTGTLGYASGTLSWTGTLTAGTTATITYSVKVASPVAGDKLLSNSVSSTTLGTNCATGSTDTRCRTSVTVSGLSITRTADVATTTPGSTVRLTVVATNSGRTAYSGATFTDNLAATLDDATYNGDATTTAGTLSYAKPSLTWTGNLAVGASVRVSYTVTVADPDPGDRLLEGTVTSPTAGSTCPSSDRAASCTATTTVLVPALAIRGTAAVSTTTPGAEVVHTVTISNTGQTPYTAARVAVALAGALDDATYGADATASSGAVVYAAGVLTWTGDLAVGATATLTFSLTVLDPDAGDRTLTTVTSSAAAGSTCPPGGTGAACTSRVTVLVPALTTIKTSDVSSTTPGSVVRYTVRVANTGQTAYTGATFSDPLAGVLDDATWNDDVAATSGTVGLTGATLGWTGDLAVGASATVTYSVTVRDPDPGDRSLTGTLTSSTPFATCASGSTDARCTSTVPVLLPGLTLGVTADAASTLPGSTLRYTFTATNTGETAYAGTAVTIDLTGVLDDATSGDDYRVSTGSLTQPGSGAIVWTLDLAVGASATATGSVRVRDRVAGDRSLVASIASNAAGSGCPTPSTAPGCRSVVPLLVPGLTITKTASSTSVLPGAQVGYTITVVNDGESVQDAVLTDQLDQVLRDATYDGNASATAGTVSYGSGALTWSGRLAVGATATITYSVTVLDPDPGDKRIVSTVVSATPGSNCLSGSADARCTAVVDVLVPQLTLTKAADRATTAPGKVVVITVTATNTGAAPYTGATFSDGLAGLLDDATPVGDAVASVGSATVGGGQLTWTGDLAVGASTTVTYSVRVNAADVGDDLLTSVLVSTSRGSTCVPGGTDSRCTLTVPVARLVLSQSFDEQTATPGSVVHARALFLNTGQVPYTDIRVDLTSDGTDDTLSNGDQSVSSGTLVVNPPSAYWTGSIPVGGAVTASGSFTVRDPDPGDKIIYTAVTSAAPGNNCPVGGADTRCGGTVRVVVPQLSITTSAASSTTTAGSTVGHTITIVNTGETPYAGATVTEDLTGLLDDAVYEGDVTTSGGSVRYAAPTLTWTGDLAVGASVTITYRVTVRDPDPGDKVLQTTVFSGVVGSTCPAGSGSAACRSSVTVLTPRLTLTKTSDVPYATAGGYVVYTITVTNTGQTSYAQASFTDSLAGVLTDASYLGGAQASSGTLDYSAPVLSWSGRLEPGDSATVVYRVTVANPTSGTQLRNTVVSSDAGSNCPVSTSDSRCTSTVSLVPTVALTVAKQADVAYAVPGGRVTYTVTAINSSARTIDTATVTDPLASVLDDASWNADAAADRGTVDLDGTDLRWTGSLPSGGSVTITYSVTVSSAVTGDQLLTDRVVSTTSLASTNCASGSTDVRCSTSLTIARLEISQRFVEPSTTPGSLIHLVATYTNTGTYPFTGITVVSPGSDTVDDAVGIGDQTASSGSLSLTPAAVTWTGDVPVTTPDAVGQVRIAATLAVNDPDTGNRLISNTSVSDAPGSNCASGSTDSRCTAAIRVLVPRLSITKTASTSYTVPGGRVGYTITIANTGETPYVGATVSDSLAGVLDDAVYDGNATATAGSLGDDPRTLSWTGDLAVGARATITYSVTATSSSTGDKIMVNPVVSSDNGSTCPPASGAAGCRVTVLVLTPALSLTATASRSTAAPGDLVGYTVTAVNTGQTSYGAATFDVPLGDLLDDAADNGDATASTGTVVRDGSSLRWTGALAPGASATVTFSVTVASPVTGSSRLRQSVVSATQGSTCALGSPDPRCSTDVPVSGLRITSDADVTTTQPGGVVTFTGVFTNTGQVPYYGITVENSFAGALDDATYGGDATATSGSLVAVPGSGVISWSGDLPVGASVTVTGSVTVNNPDRGDHRLVTVISTTASGSSCPVGGSAVACRTAVVVLEPALAVRTSADTVTASPGGPVAYTLTIDNTGETDYTAAEVDQALGGVLDDAAYNEDAVASSGSVVLDEDTLRWVGDVARGTRVTVQFSVRVDAPDLGDKLLTTAASSDVVGSSCPRGATAAACSSTVRVLVPAFDTTITAGRTTTTPGSTVPYTVVLTNTGETAADGAVVDVLLDGVLDDAAFGGDAVSSRGDVDYSAPRLTWTGDLPVGASATVTFSVVVAQPPTGDRELVATLDDTRVAGSTCRPGAAGGTCTSTVAVLLPGLAVRTTASVATASPGEPVALAITVANTGETSYASATVSASLADVVDDATVVGTPTASGGQVRYTAPALTWSGALPLGTSVTITVAVVVNPATQLGDRRLSTTAVSDDPGSSCPADPTSAACSAVVAVLLPSLSVRTSADAATTTPGATVTFTTVVQNDGETEQTDVSVRTSLAGLVAEATYNGDATVTGGGVLSQAGAVQTWTGTLPVGASATIRFSVTVNNPATGDRELSTSVTSAAAGSSCVEGGSAAGCSTTVQVLVPALQITKTASAGSVVAGDALRYTVTVVNTGQTAYAPATFRDDLTNVLDDAGYGADATTTSGTVTYADGALVWSGALDPGASATITYSVRTTFPAVGDHLMSSTVVSSSTGANCVAGLNRARCRSAVTVLVPQLSLSKTASSTSAVAGSTLAYTLTATNTGQSDYPAAAVEDDLAGVLDDAAYAGDVTASAGTASYSSGVLRWTGPLARGATVVITYSVTIDVRDTGDRLLNNVVTSPTLGSTCLAGGATALCTATTTVDADVLTLSGVTSSFRLTGLPGDTVEQDGAVGLTVTTNLYNGYAVSVRATRDLTAPGTDDTIPVDRLGVRPSGDGSGPFRPLSTSRSVQVHSEDRASAPGGDAVGNDYQVQIPFVDSAEYGTTIEYVVTPQ